MTKENDSKRPTHGIFQVIGEGEHAHWIRIGAAWANRDGKGFSLRFDAFGINGRTVIRENTDKEDANKDGQQ